MYFDALEKLKESKRRLAEVDDLLQEIINNICEEEKLSPSLYISYRGDTPVAYRYGEPWRAMQLAMEGGYPTPEEAKEAWEREVTNERNTF